MPHLKLLSLLADGAGPAEKGDATIAARGLLQTVLRTHFLSRGASHEPAQREL